MTDFEKYAFILVLITQIINSLEINGLKKDIENIKAAKTLRGCGD